MGKLLIIIINYSSIYSVCYLRWNTFGSIPPINIGGQSERVDLVDRVIQQQAHYISFNRLRQKNEREAPPPPYESPPPYHVALAMWGCPNTIVSEPVLV